MMRGRLILIAVLSLLPVSGCGNFFTDRTDNGGGSSSKFAYVTNFNGGGAGSVSSFSVDTTTGLLTSLGTAVATGAGGISDGPAALTISGNFLYTANDGGGISAFTINTTNGALTEVSGSPFAADIFPTAIVAHPNGKF